MSGRRRRGDGWDEGRRDAHDDRRDPRGDGGVDDWTGRDRHRGDAADRPGSPAGGVTGRGARDGRRAAGGYERGGYDNLRYDAASGYGGKRDAGNGYPATSGYGGTGYGGTGYGDGRTAASEAYQGSAYGSNGYGAGGYDATSHDVGYRGGEGSAAGYGNDAGYGNEAGYGNDAGYGAVANGVNGGPASGFVPEFTPVGSEDADDGQPKTPRPIGRLSIYTLHDDMAAEFDRLAERAAEGVKAAEPDTLVFVIHVVPKAPMQRIIYEIYRDRAAFESHERQPHIQQFAADCASCVLATNIIDLRLKYAKVAALGAMPSDALARPQANRTPRALESAAPVASFTPAEDRYATVNGQYSANGREQYSPPAQYGNAGNGAYGADNSQYGGTGAYSAAASGAANAGYPAANGANGYSSSNGYPSTNGYSSVNGYSGANGYQGANGYPSANGYPNGNGYADPATSSGAASGGSAGYGNGAGYPGTAAEYANGTAEYQNGGYANGSGGYANANGAYANGTAGYANGSGAYANGAYANGSGSYANGNGAYANGNGANGNGAGYSAAANGYGTAGYQEAGDAAQYGTGRYRELPSGQQAGSAGYPGGTGAYQDDRDRAARGQASEWDPRASQGQR
jgi:quinol monooxygenase YgiN